MAPHLHEFAHFMISKSFDICTSSNDRFLNFFGQDQHVVNLIWMTPDP